MTILGVALIAIGLIANLPILKTIGIGLAAIGVLFWLLGRFGHGVNHLVLGARARDCGVAVPVFADGGQPGRAHRAVRDHAANFQFSALH